MDWQKLVYIIIDELTKASEQHSCIIASAVLLDVLRAKGIGDAYPLTVKPRVLNPSFVERLKREPMPQTPELQAQWAAEGCSLVAVGHGEGSAKQWPAHLIVVIPKALSGRDFACDLTIAQANVPDWGIHLIPLMMAVPEAFLNGSREFKAPVNGSIVVYMAFPDDRSFEQTPIWKNPSKRAVIVKRILARL